MAANPLTADIGIRAPSIIHTGATVETFDEYYERDYRSLLGLAYVLSGSRWLAEDLVQDAMTEAHRNWTKVAHYDDPAAWVRRVMVNKHSSRGRRMRTEAKGLLRLAGRRQETFVSPTEQTGEVWAAVRELPTRQAQAIALFYWEDRAIRDIATIMGTSEETAKTHLKRGRSSLADALDGHRGDSS